MVAIKPKFTIIEMLYTSMLLPVYGMMMTAVNCDMPVKRKNNPNQLNTGGNRS